MKKKYLRLLESKSDSHFFLIQAILMIKICVLGNSHVASLKQGYEKIKNKHTDFSLTFFAARGRDLLALNPSENSLVPGNEELARKISFTSGGLSQINLLDFDFCLIYGMVLAPRKIDSRISSNLKNLACRDNLITSPNFQLARKVRSISAIPIYMGHEPLRCQRGEISAEGSFYSFQEILDSTRNYINLVNTSLVGQPPDTIESEWHTEERYTTNANRLDLDDLPLGATHCRGDGIHMNGDFGEIYLEQLFTLMTKPKIHNKLLRSLKEFVS